MGTNTTIMNIISSSVYKKYVITLNISFLLVVACLFLIIQSNSVELPFLINSESLNILSPELGCNGLKTLNHHQDKCLYIKSKGSCVSEGYINYLYIFYCHFGNFPILGYCLMFLWLLVLFYLLGNTASEYFCSSLEDLSDLLKLSPTIAGVTLLSLGNGAPDVFSSLVSFMGDDTSDVGFNTVLGGASFVTCVVVGIIGILVKRKRVRINRNAFVRDVCFFLFVLASLILILICGKINLWGAIGFFLMYIAYVIVVYLSDIHWSNLGNGIERDASLSCGNDLSIPILNNIMVKEEANSVALEAGDEALNAKKCCFCLPCSARCCMLLQILEMPLYLPRRLTIPVVCGKKWSKPIAVTSVTLAPILLSALWNLQSQSTGIHAYGIGFLVGLTLGAAACATTETSTPPKTCLLPWLAGGFLMSVIWSYIIAQELVALLVSLGYLFELSPSILGLTVLAWGNSLGDLITNITLAMNGGPQGAQVAISGSYAGPIFNILFGLGLSLVCSTWHQYPSSLVILRDPYLLETIGFLMGGLIWALVVLPWRNMKLDGFLGIGLVALYFVSVSLRVIQTLGSFQFLGLEPETRT